MNRLLLLCLLVSAQAHGKGLPPFDFAHPNTLTVFSAVADTIPPTIECPASDTIQLNVGQCDSMYNYVISADDDQPNFILIQLNGLASGSSFQLGTTLNSFLVTDLAGNTATCSFTVTVLGAGSMLTCDDFVEIELGANCTTTIQPEQILLPPFGCTGDDVVQIDRTPPFGNGPWVPGILYQTDLGKTYAVQVVDLPTGNKCWGNITVVDVAPTLTCSDITVHCVVENLEPEFLKDSLGIANVFPVLTDNCPGVTTDFVDFQQTLPCNPNNNLNGTVTRVWTATDISGNTATCQQVIGLVRSLAGIEFPAGDTVSCTEELNFDLLGAPVLKIGNQQFSLWPASACDFEVQFDDATLINYCGGGSKVSRTWSVIDICQPSNTVTGVQIIDFVDENGPVLTCDSSVTVVADATDCLITFDIPDVSFTDDCSQVNSVVAIWDVADTQDTLAGTLSVPAPATQASFVAVANFPAGISTLTYLAKDECGNTGTCQTIVTVWDTDPPIADCITFFTVVLGENGEFALGADTLDLNSRDSCNQQLYFKMRRATPSPNCFPSDQFDDAVLFCCSDIGDTIELTRRVYDVEVPEGPVSPDFAPGQFSDCVVKIEVLDTLPLLCVAPPDIIVNCVDFDPQFSDYGTPVFNCLVDSSAVSADFSQFDSTCSEGKVLRTFQVFDKNGNSAACSQQITVEHVQDYYIKFPDDVIVTACDGSNNFGEPEFSRNGCEDLAFSFEDEIFTVVPDACYKIERTWTIWNRCTYDSTASLIGIPNPEPNAVPNHPDNLPGPIVSAPGADTLWTSTVVKLSPVAPAATDFSTYWAADANAYVYKQVIKVIDTQDPVVNDCPTAALSVGDTTNNDSLLWNQTYWLDPATNQNDLCESEAALSITASDACSGENLNISCLLFLNTDGDAIQETVINSNNPPAPGTVNFNNFSTPNYAGGTPHVFDGRPVLPNEVYRWALHESSDSNQRTVSVQWKTFDQMPTPGNPNGLPGVAPQLPHGTHKIRWIVSDACGNETTCEYSFTIKDSKVPAVACLQGLTVEIPLSGSIEMSDADFLQSNEDNCTPTPLIKRGVRIAGAGAGFPENGNGDPQTKITFDCGDLGQQSVELWAEDLAGNATFCTADIVVADADSSCNLSQLTIAGNVVVDNTTLQLSATNPFAAPVMLTQQADDQGNFQFTQAIFSGSDYMLTPTNDENHLNGVSTFDLLLITRHILGLEPLDTPYKIISADASRNNSVTTFDIVEIRKLILGIYTEFPDNTSWRFVDADYVFPDTANPFLFTFPEKITRTAVISDQLEDDFIPAKIGDVNNSALLDNFSSLDDRSEATLFFDLQNRSVQSGEEFTVRFKAAEPTLGYQFTLNTGDLEVLNILPGEGLDAGNFAVFEDAVTTSVENGAGEFAVVFRAGASGKLSEMLSVSSRITRAEAYKTDSKMAEVALRFDDGAVSQPGFELFQNQPNPFRDRTVIGFNLPENADATLTIFDETGRVLFTQSGHYARGYHAVSFEKTLLGDAGIFYYKLETEKESAVRKMVLIK